MEPFERFLLFVFLFLVGFIALVTYLLRLSAEHKKAGKDEMREILSRAAAKGRAFENGMGEVVWKIHGKLPDERPWTLAYCTGYTEQNRSDLRDPKVMVRDMGAGQRLEWRCPALKRDAYAFSLFKRTDNEKRPEEVVFEGDDAVWQRWRLEARDQALARRVFSPRVCELIAKFPAADAWKSKIDQRTTIMLGTDGLDAVLGIEYVSADHVDVLIETCEAMAAGLEANVATPT